MTPEQSQEVIALSAFAAECRAWLEQDNVAKHFEMRTAIRRFGYKALERASKIVEWPQ